MSKFEIQRKAIVTEFYSRGDWTKIEFSVKISTEFSEEPQIIFYVFVFFNFEGHSCKDGMGIVEEMLYTPAKTLVDSLIQNLEKGKISNSLLSIEDTQDFGIVI